MEFVIYTTRWMLIPLNELWELEKGRMGMEEIMRI